MGKIPWDNPDRPLRSGWTPREKNRAKRISLKVEDLNHSLSDNDYIRYGRLMYAHSIQKNIKVRKRDLHKDRQDFAVGRRNILFSVEPRMPTEPERGLRRIPRNAPKKDIKAIIEYMDKNPPGAKNDEQRNDYYVNGPKSLKEPK